MVLMGGGFRPGLIYDVSDPLHPRLVCSFLYTTAHLVTGDTFAYLRPVSTTETDIVLHSIGSGNESVVAQLPFESPEIAWVPQGGLAAYTAVQPVDTNDPAGSTQVWILAGGRSSELYAFRNGFGDCICRFGLPPPVLSFSPDGQYLVSGWAAGKGAEPLAVYRLSDHVRVLTADSSVYDAIWSRTGHRLFLIGFGTGMHAWAPESGVTSMAGPAWAELPSLSPDGGTAAYTAFLDVNTQSGLRIYTDDIATGTTQQLSGSTRSQVLFVRAGWVWYLEEQACADCVGGTQPTGRVMARQLPSGAEQLVTFVSGDDPIGEGGTYAALTMSDPEFWPSS